MPVDDEAEFWARLDEFVRAQDIVVDRPAGSRHPRFPDYVYPLDYGHLAGSRGGDGEEVDIWVGAGDPSVTGVVCTLDPMRRDAELKVLWAVTPADFPVLQRFYRPQPQVALLVPRPASGA